MTIFFQCNNKKRSNIFPFTHSNAYADKKQLSQHLARTDIEKLPSVIFWSLNIRVAKIRVLKHHFLFEICMIFAQFVVFYQIHQWFLTLNSKKYILLLDFLQWKLLKLLKMKKYPIPNFIYIFDLQNFKTFFLYHAVAKRIFFFFGWKNSNFFVPVVFLTF